MESLKLCSSGVSAFNTMEFVFSGRTKIPEETEVEERDNRWTEL